MPIRTKRWDDPAEQEDGFRLLVCRYRPRALPKEQETWDAWQPELGPSPDLHARYYAKRGSGLAWGSYHTAYLREMRAQGAAIEALARRVASGETLTLLCSSACVHESRCHRSLLRELIEERVAALGRGDVDDAAP